MHKRKRVVLLVLVSLSLCAAEDDFVTDTVKTSEHDLLMTFIGHGTLMFQYGGRVIHIDPVRRYADYSKLPKADIILITHAHGDHLDPGLVEKLLKSSSDILMSRSCQNKLNKGTVLQNGDEATVQGIHVSAVPAYNIKHKRDTGEPYHPRGDGNGYVLTFADKKVYIAGDTENIPELKSMENISIAFLPMNLPYTMSPEMVADAVNLFKPDILYPYHYGNTDVNKVVELLKESDTKVRIRDLQ